MNLWKISQSSWLDFAHPLLNNVKETAIVRPGVPILKEMKYKDTARKTSTAKLAGRITPPLAAGDLLVLSTLTELSPWEHILII